MRNIRKNPEPVELVQHRCNPGATYDGPWAWDKDPVREALVNEQHGLCCYCMSRITKETSTIEHWYPQSKYRDDKQWNAEHPDQRPRDLTNHGDLDYGNLLAVCKGIITTREKVQHRHCGESREDNPLKFNPAADDVESHISFSTRDGTILSTDDDFKTQLDTVLNLNNSFLKNNRIAVLNGFTEEIQKRFKATPLSKPYLDQKLAEWTGSHHSNSLTPYCQIVVYWIRKRLSRP